MKKHVRGYGISSKDLVATIHELAGSVSRGDRSLDLQAPILTATEAMIEMRHLQGAMLLNRISLMLITDDGKENIGYEYIRRRVRAMRPLDPEADSEALRSLANELRGE